VDRPRQPKGQTTLPHNYKSGNLAIDSSFLWPCRSGNGWPPGEAWGNASLDRSRHNVVTHPLKFIPLHQICHILSFHIFTPMPTKELETREQLSSLEPKQLGLLVRSRRGPPISNSIQSSHGRCFESSVTAHPLTHNRSALAQRETQE
jgi:hypothetical protein